MATVSNVVNATPGEEKEVQTRKSLNVSLCDGVNELRLEGDVGSDKNAAVLNNHDPLDKESRTKKQAELVQKALNDALEAAEIKIPNDGKMIPNEASTVNHQDKVSHLQPVSNIIMLNRIFISYYDYLQRIQLQF